MKDKTYKNTTYKELEITAKARLFIKRLQEDIAEFAAFDPNFNQAFIDSVTALEKELTDLPDDRSMRAIIGVETAELKKVVGRCCDLMYILAFFVRKAFPDNYGEQQQFGIFKFKKIKTKLLKFEVEMQLMGAKVEQFESVLASVGLSQAYIDELKSVHLVLSEAMHTQYTAKKQRKITTETRLQLMNEVWENLSRISRVSKFIYSDDYGKYQAYLLYG
jgi:hypothetical protein